MSDLIRRMDAVQPDAAALIRWHDMLLQDFGDDLSSIVRAEMLAMLDEPAVQPVTVRLVFSNADATPKTTVLDVSAEAVPDIMAWYGAYCAGDRYTVTVDGRNVPMDQNGEPTHVNEAPKREHDAANMLTPATKGGDA